MSTGPSPRRHTLGERERLSTKSTRAQENHPYPWKQKIGQSIQLLLDKNHMDARALAQKLGVQTSAVSQWLMGHTQPSPVALVEISCYFDVSIDWILCKDLVGFTPDEMRALKRTLPGHAHKLRDRMVCAEPVALG